MKDMNKNQIDRIKQLFTEERLHGNLVDSKEVLEEQLFDKERRKANKEDRKEKRADMKAARKEKRSDIKAAKNKFKSSKDDIKQDLKQDLEQNKQKSKSTEGPTEEPQTASVEQPKPKAKSGGGSGKSGKSGDSKDVLKDKEPKKLDGSRLQKGFDYVIDNNKDVYKISKKTGKIDTVYTFNESFDKSLLFKSVLSENWKKLIKESYYTVQTSEGPKKMSDTFTKIASSAFDGEVVDIDKVGVTITLPFKNDKEGNAFRQWVNDNHLDIAKKLNLDPKGSFNNTYIQRAYEELGEEYQESKNSTPSIDGDELPKVDLSKHLKKKGVDLPEVPEEPSSPEVPEESEKQIDFDWSSGSPGKLNVVGNHLVNLGGIQRFLDGMVDSLDPTVSEDDGKDLLKNINLIKDIKLKKRMYYKRAQKIKSFRIDPYFWRLIPENEEGSLLSALLKLYEKDESGDTVSGDIKKILDNSDYMKSNKEERRKILQDILNIVKNY